MTDDPFDNAEWRGYEDYVRREVAPAMEGSAVVISIVPNADEVDVKAAVEIGLMILLDKPLVAVVTDDRPVPPKLAAVADAVVKLDPDLGPEQQAAAIQAALAAALR